MPFSEFITSGDLKFIIAFFIFSGWAIVHFFKKVKARQQQDDTHQILHHNSKINHAAFWILILSVLSLLLGLMHSFYFIGKTGGIAPGLIFQGVSYALITPVLGICLFICCKTLKGTFNESSSK
ncbi:hypothetical protein [uncultured Dokdonia sp.]|uniref:hypothetical protein n=1 Tax=uncultured Dokdonia sp. TaxID=575653 RepID=UPI00261B6598|nr:hypothetical protein [uncultured Dokdonia sp.]